MARWVLHCLASCQLPWQLLPAASCMRMHSVMPATACALVRALDALPLVLACCPASGFQVQGQLAQRAAQGRRELGGGRVRQTAYWACVACCPTAPAWPEPLWSAFPRHARVAWVGTHRGAVRASCTAASAAEGAVKRMHVRRPRAAAALLLPACLCAGTVTHTDR